MPPTPKVSLKRPEFHVWLTPADTPDADIEDHYLGVIQVTNQDQLVGEVQARPNGITKPGDQPFAMTNLWLWAALVRLGHTAEKYQAVSQRLEYRPLDKSEKEAGEAEADPT